ncbi:type II secretion system protein [Candidatus Shapirobacteria bacterium]|nr:type II secretion system protein [Candidatus Shapirobacteria bacterium]
MRFPKNKKQTHGFTLVEILIVVGILGIIAAVGTNVFFTTFRGSTKTKVLTKVKQNGDYALSTMERLIRNAQEVVVDEDAGDLCQANMSKIKIKKLDGTEILFSCENIGTVNGFIASDAARLTSNEVKVDICSFSCTTKGLPGKLEFYPQAIEINFTLSQAAVANRPEEEATLNFNTTVSTRNF